MHHRRTLVRFALAVLVTWTIVAAPSSAAPARPDGPGRTIRNGDVTLWYAVRGGNTRAVPLVVVNGGPGFDHQLLLVSDAWDRLALRRPVVMYDQRGNGRSGPLTAEQSCTLRDQVADLEAIRAALGVPRIDLLGHSWGGFLAMAYAATHSEHVDHLIILDSAAPKWSDTEFIFNYVYPETQVRSDRLDALDALGDSTAHAASMLEYMSMLCVSRELSDRLVEASAGFGYRRDINARLNADLASKDLNPLLPGFTMPTLVMTGRFDINVAPSTAWRIHQAIPGSRWAVFEKSGHLPFYEEPEAFVKTVEGFLGGR